MFHEIKNKKSTGKAITREKQENKSLSKKREKTNSEWLCLRAADKVISNIYRAHL